MGDNVLAGTINQEGALVIRVSRPAGESTLARLIKMVEQAQSEKAKTQRFIDRAEQFYALGVIVMTVFAIVVPLALLDEAFQVTFYRAMTLMVAASPCAVVISTPATVLSAIANGGRRGVLFKGGAYVEEAATIKVVAFDKTGTLTYGRPRVTDVKPMNGESADDLLWLAASLEQKSEHPLAQAILRAAAMGNRPLSEASEFKSHTGMGVSGKVAGRQLIVGNERLMRQYSQSEPITESNSIQALQAEGKTVVVVAEQTEGRLSVLGAIGIADALRESTARVIKLLKARGVQRVVMLTGDHETVAGHIGEQAGVDEVFAGLMPEDKLRILKELSARYGPVAMVGDGVNDAPALAAANIGIAMGAAGTDVALETADIVLMADDLGNIPYVLALSQKTRRILTQNLIFAFAVILVLVGSVLGIGLALPLSVIGHEGSTVLVSLNGLRMLGFSDLPKPDRSQQAISEQ
jgi:Cd2+/Zn2+-exporting ATPase